jgi:tetratricopeptide (TPR) repeat protein
MRNLAKTILAMTLAVCATPYANAAPDIPSSDRLAASKSVEEKGDLARIHNEFGDAASYYQKALRLNPHSAELYNKLGIVEFKLGAKGAARKHFSQAAKYDPRNVAAFNNLGALALVEKKYNPAVRYLKQALAIDETNATAHLNLAEAWMGLEAVDRAMTEYARALQLDADILTAGRNGVIAQVSTPEQRARVDFLIAKAYAKRGNLDGALEYLRRAKEGHYPDLAKVYSDQEFAALWPDPRLEKIIKR